MRKDGADFARFRALISVPCETEQRLRIYVDLLSRWQTTTNLISRATLESVWTRHVADSAQLFDFVPDKFRWVDMGSGAGFPGMVIAIRLAKTSEAIVHCIESDRRKCAFLREVARETDAAVQVHAARIEDVCFSDTGRIDALTARGFAPLVETLQTGRKWLNEGATGVFPRGNFAAGDVDALRAILTSRIELKQSIVDSASTVVVVRPNAFGKLS